MPSFKSFINESWDSPVKYETALTPNHGVRARFRVDDLLYVAEVSDEPGFTGTNFHVSFGRLYGAREGFKYTFVRPEQDEKQSMSHTNSVFSTIIRVIVDHVRSRGFKIGDTIQFSSYETTGSQPKLYHFVTKKLAYELGLRIVSSGKWNELRHRDEPVKPKLKILLPEDSKMKNFTRLSKSLVVEAVAWTHGTVGRDALYSFTVGNHHFKLMIQHQGMHHLVQFGEHYETPEDYASGTADVLDAETNPNADLPNAAAVDSIISTIGACLGNYLTTKILKRNEALAFPPFHGSPRDKATFQRMLDAIALKHGLSVRHSPMAILLVRTLNA